MAILAVLVVLTIVFGVGAAIVLRTKWIEEERRRARTLSLLTQLGNICCRPVAMDVSESDPTGQQALERTFNKSGETYYHRPGITPSGWVENADELWREHFREQKPLRDGWSNLIHYRCPGPVHKNGWDLISSGPNGIYEEGGGDDILVGDDVPGGIAAIVSRG